MSSRQRLSSLFEELAEPVEAFVQHPPVGLRPLLDVLEAPRADGAPRARPSVELRAAVARTSR
jgi:hypothetical protein